MILALILSGMTGALAGSDEGDFLPDLQPWQAGFGGAYDMGVPEIGEQEYGAGEMNMAVFWVQKQLKATGVWYQGDQWDCSGRMGDGTISAIQAFMRDRGYTDYTGAVDRTVINELAAYLGGKLEPVFVGGIYDHMASIMQGGSAGSMAPIVPSSQDSMGRASTGAKWVQVCLKHLGYYTGNVDGKYGEGTTKAVRDFQRDYGWEQLDYVSLGVARAMLEVYYLTEGDLNELP